MICNVQCGTGTPNSTVLIGVLILCMAHVQLALLLNWQLNTK